NGGNADLQTALSALEEVKTTDVMLLPGFDNIFRYDNKGNKEIIMAVHFRDLESGNTFFTNFYLQAAQIPANLDDKAKELIGAGGGQNYHTLRPEVRNLFTPDDSRRDATFIEAYTKTSPVDSTYY